MYRAEFFAGKRGHLGGESIRLQPAPTSTLTKKKKERGKAHNLVMIRVNLAHGLHAARNHG
jgi:hypothetical protein